MISLASLCSAVRLALDNKSTARTQRQKTAERKRLQQIQKEREWREELAARADREALAEKDRIAALAAKRAADIAEQERQRQEATQTALTSLDEMRATVGPLPEIDPNALSELQEALERKRLQQEQIEIAWREEQARRAEYMADADGSRAAAKAELAERQQQERLDEQAAAIANWQRKHF